MTYEAENHEHRVTRVYIDQLFMLNLSRNNKIHGGVCPTGRDAKALRTCCSQHPLSPVP